MSYRCNNYLKRYREFGNPSYKYKNKLKRLKAVIRETVFENAALCDEICDIREQLLIRMEERRFLLRKLCEFDPRVLANVQKLIHNNFPQPTAIPFAKKSRRRQSNAVAAAEGSNGTNCKQQQRSRKSSSATTPKTKKKVVDLIPLDPTTGRPIFPIALGNLSVHSLGDVHPDRPEFHSHEAIYPVGYLSTRVFANIQDPTVTCTYMCRISESMDRPRFEICMEHEPTNPIAGGSPDICHSVLLQKINESLGMNVVSIRPKGHEFFGLVHPTILNLIQSFPGTRKCVNYKWSKFEVSKNANDRHVEDLHACLNFEVLQSSISYCKYKMSLPMLPADQSSRNNVVSTDKRSDFIDLL